MSTNNKNILYCSFCGKSQHEVRKLIAGPTVFICDECVELCMDIIKEESKDSPESRPSRPTDIDPIFSFLHLIAIALPISPMVNSFNCSGYMPLISFSLKIDLLTSIFSFFICGCLS